MSTQTIPTTTSTGTETKPVDLKLEVVVLPVSDAERSKAFYESLGWRLDADFVFSETSRVLQFTPPGSDASIIFGTALARRRPAPSAGSCSPSPTSRRRTRSRRAGRRRERGLPRHRRRVRRRGARVRCGAGARRLPVVRVVQRPGRQRLAAAGGQHAPAQAGDGSELRAAQRPRRGAAARRRGPRRARGAQRRQYDEEWPDWYAAYMVAEQAGTELPA